ncbi:MAG: hypothetical protein Q7T34_00125, partial [Candidatus Parcubacteria bacterium]|nr:hypothetical protein [Candidatus Parcubacteria bacterium]
LKEPGVVLAGPIWHRFLEKALIKYPKQTFEKPELLITGKDIIDGIINLDDPHSILNYIKKTDPLGDTPLSPEDDPQYENWEFGIKNWLLLNQLFSTTLNF